MKKKLIALIIAGLTATVGKALAAFDPSVYSSVLVATEAVQILPSSYTVDLNAIGASKISFQTNFATVAISAAVFYDGKASTVSFTISSNTALNAATSFINITVSSNTGLYNAAITFSQGLYGPTFIFKEGRDFTAHNWSTATAAFPDSVNENSTTTAQGIANVMNFSTYGVVVSTFFFASSTPSYVVGVDPALRITTGPNVVVVRAIFPGTYANVWSLQSSTQFALSVGGSTGTAAVKISTGLNYFTRGRDPAVLKISSFSFTCGTDWIIQNTASGTAQAISSAIVANSLASPIVISSFTQTVAVVFATSNFVTSLSTWANWFPTMGVYTSTQAALSLSNLTALNSDGSGIGAMTSGFANQIDTASAVISTANAFVNGLAVLYSTAGTGLQWASGGLSVGTTYFVTNRTPTRFALSRTSTGSAAGVTLAITTTAPMGGGTYSLTPMPFFGTAINNWKYSNDGLNWISIPGVTTTVTGATLPNSTTFFDLSATNAANARWLMLNVQSSSSTPVTVPTIINLKR